MSQMVKKNQGQHWKRAIGKGLSRNYYSENREVTLRKQMPQSSIAWLESFENQKDDFLPGFENEEVANGISVQLSSRKGLYCSILIDLLFWR